MPLRPRLFSASSQWLLFTTVFATAFLGCTSPLFRGQSPETDELDGFVDLSSSESPTRLVGDLAVPWGLNWIKVEGVGLVTNLAGTGSDPAPSPLRDKLIKEIQTHDVNHYTKLLASDDTSMVIVRGFIPPAAQQGDIFDVEVRIPPRSQTTDLNNGWLMQARLRELRFLDTVREGHVAALVGGSILVDALFAGTGDPLSETTGRIAGGGKVTKARPIGLAISNEFVTKRTSRMIGAAINERFSRVEHGTKKGVANPKRDNLVELAVHPRYRNNLGRYVRVIRSIAVGENAGDRAVRLTTLERMLLEPTTAEAAALQLEAIGKEGIPVLQQAVQSPDPEVRFYAAEALAYLDDAAATTPLRDAAEQERAFRWRALTALSTMDAYEAKEALVSLMHVVSAETRYGAFRALRGRNWRDSLVRGEVLDDKFGFHLISSNQEPMLHFSRTRRPELVVFGDSVSLRPPPFLYAGSSILIKRVDDQTLRLSCFRPGKEDQIEECSADIGELVRTIAKMGGGYADVFECLRSAKEQGYLHARIDVDAIPRANRRYQREQSDSLADPSERRFRVTNPIPEMFSDRLGRTEDGADEVSPELSEELDLPQTKRTKSGFFGKLTSWFVD